MNGAMRVFRQWWFLAVVATIAGFAWMTLRAQSPSNLQAPTRPQSAAGTTGATAASPVIVAAPVPARPQRVEFTWPTPNPAFMAGQGIAAFIQHAGSGEPESGTFGGVRSGGHQFHEGLDLKALNRDRHGEPIDPVFAAMDGIVRHINNAAGDSSYGRYIVLEHPEMTPGVYTLYAHLSRIAPGLRSGERVTRGQTIGTMGHSSGGYAIPRDRAHLHFEIGVMVTRDFQTWYELRKFGSPNDHGQWNGKNLMGIDPLEFATLWRDHRIDTFAQYFARLQPAVRLRVATRRVPDFVLRYPSLLTRELPPGGVGGWEIAFDWTGLPFSWTPLEAREVMGLATDQPILHDVNHEIARAHPAKVLTVTRRGGALGAGRDLEPVLQQLFGWR